MMAIRAKFDSGESVCMRVDDEIYDSLLEIAARDLKKLAQLHKSLILSAKEAGYEKEIPIVFAKKFLQKQGSEAGSGASASSR